jgi:hypothetical protein
MKNWKNWFIGTFLVIFYIGLFTTSCQAQNQAPMEYVNSFYDEAYSRHKRIPIKDVQISYANLSNSNGKSMLLEDGSILIVIDREFYNYYFGGTQVKRLVYYLLGHELLKLNKTKGDTIMNENKVYYRLKDTHINELFL